MKTKRVDLLNWMPREGELLDVDWPKVHAALGVDHTKWLLEQPHDQCQLMFEIVDHQYRLVAEFYDEKLLATYYLMWAK